MLTSERDNWNKYLLNVGGGEENSRVRSMFFNWRSAIKKSPKKSKWFMNFKKIFTKSPENPLSLFRRLTSRPSRLTVSIKKVQSPGISRAPLCLKREENFQTFSLLFINTLNYQHLVCLTLTHLNRRATRKLWLTVNRTSVHSKAAKFVSRSLLSFFRDKTSEKNDIFCRRIKIWKKFFGGNNNNHRRLKIANDFRKNQSNYPE